MTNYVRKAFGEVLEEIDWMDDETKEQARKKLNGMLQMIGYPDELLNDEILAELHDPINIDKKDFFGSKLSVAK